MSKLSPEDKGFRQGVAWAIWFLARFHREDSLAKDMLNESGITLSQFTTAGVDTPDLPVIRKLWRELQR